MIQGADMMARVRTGCGALLLMWAGLSLPMAVSAEDGTCGVERDTRRGTLDELTWRQLNTIYEQVGEERYGEAFDDLSRMLERAGRDRYLRAILNQALGQVEWARGNYESSLGHYERAVELDTLPDETHFALMYQIAQLYYLQDRLDEALASLELWFCSVPPARVPSAAYVLQAAMQARREDHAAALEAIDQAIAMDDDPQEDWYLLKLAAHYELEQYPQAGATLQTLIERWPDRKRYWLQLAQVYDRLRQKQRALAVLALAHRRAMLDEQADLVYLASLYSRAELPYRAAQVMEQGIRAKTVAGTGAHWAMAADAWYAAAELERALTAYGEAGRASDAGDIDLRRAYILVDLERWSAALEALDQALLKGGLDDRRTGEAYLLRGMAQFSLDDLDSAAADWERAGRFETARDAARQWLNHLREERRRQAS
jgi:tetratricopeptide (TPR) repeat protein